MGNKAKEQRKKIHAHVFFLGARRLSRSDWDPARAEGVERILDQSSRLVQAGTYAKLCFAYISFAYGPGPSDEGKNTVKHRESDRNRAETQAR